MQNQNIVNPIAAIPAKFSELSSLAYLFTSDDIGVRMQAIFINAKLMAEVGELIYEALNGFNHSINQGIHYSCDQYSYDQSYWNSLFSLANTIPSDGKMIDYNYRIDEYHDRCNLSETQGEVSSHSELAQDDDYVEGFDDPPMTIDSIYQVEGLDDSYNLSNSNSISLNVNPSISVNTPPLSFPLLPPSSSPFSPPYNPPYIPHRLPPTAPISSPPQTSDKFCELDCNLERGMGKTFSANAKRNSNGIAKRSNDDEMAFQELIRIRDRKQMELGIINAKPKPVPENIKVNGNGNDRQCEIQSIGNALSGLSERLEAAREKQLEFKQKEIKRIATISAEIIAKRDRQQHDAATMPDSTATDTAVAHQDQISGTLAAHPLPMPMGHSKIENSVSGAVTEVHCPKSTRIHAQPVELHQEINERANHERQALPTNGQSVIVNDITTSKEKAIGNMKSDSGYKSDLNKKLSNILGKGFSEKPIIINNDKGIKMDEKHLVKTKGGKQIKDYIADDFAIPNEWIKWAEINAAYIDIVRAQVNFVTYWLGKKREGDPKGKKADWFATWKAYLMQDWAPRKRKENYNGKMPVITNHLNDNEIVLDENEVERRVRETARPNVKFIPPFEMREIMRKEIIAARAAQRR